MSALLDVARRPAESSDEKLPQPFLGASKVVGGIHRPQHRISRHLRVKRPHQAEEAFLADRRVHVLFVHSSFVSATRAASCSASFFARPVAAPSTSPLTTTST